MTYRVTFTFTNTEALDIRMALSAACSSWNDRARNERAAGNEQAAQSCMRIAEQHAALWDRVQEACEMGRLALDAA